MPLTVVATVALFIAIPKNFFPQQDTGLVVGITESKLHDIDPETYMADVLDRIVSGRIKVNAPRELLP